MTEVAGVIDQEKFTPKLEKFEVLSEGYKLRGNLFRAENSDSAPSVLLMHGAAGPDRETKQFSDPLPNFIRFQMMLSESGFNALALRNRGVGDPNNPDEQSEGSYQITLLDRVEDIKRGMEALKQIGDPDKVILIAGSMNGEVGALIAGELKDKLSALVLLEPAAYDVGVEKIPFNTPELTAKLHEPNKDLRRSPAFTALREYDGPVFVSYGDSEHVMVGDAAIVQDLYRQQAEAKGEFYVVPGAKHQLLSSPDNPEVIKMQQSVIEFLQEKV